MHIEQLTTNLIALGHEVWVNSGSPAPHCSRISHWRGLSLIQLMAMDVYYMRVEGHYPLTIPSYLKKSWCRYGFRKTLVWELNAASDLVMFNKSEQAIGFRDALDSQLSEIAKVTQLAVCNTDGLARYAKDLGIPCVKTIPLASDPSLFHPQAPPNPKITRSFGRLNVVWCGNPTVGWHDLEIIDRVSKRLISYDKIRFYILGEKPDTISFSNNVVTLGPQAYTEMPNYLSAMDVGLVTYKNDSWSRYGVFSSPLKFFDYMASGLIIVGSPIEQIVKCIRDGENGFIVPFNDDEVLANRLCYIAENKEKLKEIGAKARAQVVDYYNWKRVAQETGTAIESVLHK